MTITHNRISDMTADELIYRRKEILHLVDVIDRNKGDMPPEMRRVMNAIADGLSSRMREMTARLEQE